MSLTNLIIAFTIAAPSVAVLFWFAYEFGPVTSLKFHIVKYESGFATKATWRRGGIKKEGFDYDCGIAVSPEGQFPKSEPSVFRTKKKAERRIKKWYYPRLVEGKTWGEIQYGNAEYELEYTVPSSLDTRHDLTDQMIAAHNAGDEETEALMLNQLLEL